MNVKLVFSTAALAAVLLCQSTVTGQEIVSVDFSNTFSAANSTTSGAAVIGSAGDQFNFLVAGNGQDLPNASDLINTAGIATGLAVTNTGFDIGGFNDLGALGPFTSVAFVDSVTTGTTAISGFNVGDLVDLHVLGSQSGAEVEGGTFTISAGTTTGPSSQITTDSTLQIVSPLVEGQDFVSFLGVSPDATGTIQFDTTVAPGGSFASVAGFQLEVNSAGDAIPEPSALMLASGLIALVSLRRRKS